MQQTTAIEQVADFWDAMPCNIRHSSVQLEKDPDEFTWSISIRKYKVEPHIWEFSQFPDWNKKRVLDLGCGIGTQALTFAQFGAQVTAVDLSGESLAIAQRRAQITGQEERITFYQSDVEHLSDFVPVEKYDLVYSFGVLHHTPHPELAIAGIRKYMRKDSVFKLMLYHRYSWKVLKILWMLREQPGQSIDEKVARFSEAQSGCPMTRTYTRKSAQDLLAAFEIQQMSVDHIFPYRISDYIKHRYTQEWYWRWMPKSWFHTLERLIGWHLLITAKKAETPC